MSLLTDVLYWVTTGLMIPVVILLLVALGWSVLTLGGSYSSYLARLRLRRAVAGALSELRTRTPRELDYAGIASHHPALGVALTGIADHRWDGVHADKLVADFALDGERVLGPFRMVVRVGPMLGLMGTLIPMGPALVGLAAGDIASMASNMQMAFATTVVGIFTGGVAFVTLLVRGRWVAEDLNNLRYLVELGCDGEA